MTDCYDGMRAALRRNIEGLAHLSDDQKEALLESQMGMAIAATESGRPFVEIYEPKPVEAEEDAAEAVADDKKTRTNRLQPSLHQAF